MLVCCCTVTETVEGDPRKSLSTNSLFFSCFWFLTFFDIFFLVLRYPSMNFCRYREDMLEMLKRMEDVDGCPR